MAVEIDTWTELAAMSSGLDGDYILTGNLASTDGDYISNWTPIGGSGTEFTGSLGGQNYTIEGLTVNNSILDYVGLFGYILGATISDINFTNVSITCDDYCGAIAGQSYYSIIDNISVTISLDGDGWCGGLIGKNSNYSGTYKRTSISNCSVNFISGYTNSGSYFGGIISEGDYCDISNCSTTGNVTFNYSSKDYIGGITGDMSNGSIVDSNSDITFNFGSSYSNNDVGGVVGQLYYSTVKNCYSSCTFNNYGGDEMGGFIGSSMYSTIIGCYSTSDLTESYSSQQTDIGGFIGNNQVGSNITGCYCTGNVTVYVDNAGGFVGENTGLISNCYSYGDVTNTGASAGGFVGNVTASGNAINCYSTGSATAATNVGGFSAVDIGTNTGCVWDTSTSGMGTSASGTGKTTTEMKTLSTFTTLNWPIVDIDDADLNNTPPWLISDGSSYPLVMLAAMTISKIEGNVTLESSPINGATIRVINTISNFLENVGVTDANGDYSIPVRNGTYQVTCEYETGGIYYTDDSKPNVAVS